ncbi:MAG TPA: site-specific DNA-methyltransferase [Terriglobia bacterium]|nr:site-specific DNA-methyltransferase [Terriglobia bacterium]
MPTLDWIGKKAVLDHHRQVPYRLLKCDASLSAGDPDSGNLLIQGDNLLALKALLPYYAGKVKCIYIDPPYNTGEENWIYNDNVNSPEIRAWLGKVVGGEFEDLSRHDKWLCMMYPRLSLLQEMLRDDGAIFVSIDDHEVVHLHNIMGEIFGPANFLANIIWQKRTSPDARLNLGPAHDFVVAYAKNLERLKPTLKRVPPSGERTKAYKNPDNDPRGVWASVDLTGQTGHATPDQFYEITTRDGSKMKPPAGRCWALAERTFLGLAADNRIWFGKSGRSRPRLKKFLNEGEGVTTWTWWPHAEVGHNQEATKELNEIMGRADLFDNPKPTRLLRRLLQLATGKDSIVLDSFAGSGTTGNAVFQLNKEDGGNRKFILVEMDESICRTITAQRLARAVEGFTPRATASISGGRNEGKRVEGLGGGFRYCNLGEPLFDEAGTIGGTVAFPDLAAHVFFTETGSPISKRASGKTPFLGEYNGKALYLLFNGVLGDKSTSGGNVLTNEILRGLPEPTTKDGFRVIYGEGCRLGAARLKREGIVFRQIPYEIKTS